MPAFAANFGLLPWHIGGGPHMLTLAEIETFAAAVEAMTRSGEL